MWRPNLLCTGAGPSVGAWSSSRHRSFLEESPPLTFTPLSRKLCLSMAPTPVQALSPDRLLDPAVSLLAQDTLLERSSSLLLLAHRDKPFQRKPCEQVSPPIASSCLLSPRSSSKSSRPGSVDHGDSFPCFLPPHNKYPSTP